MTHDRPTMDLAGHESSRRRADPARVGVPRQAAVGRRSTPGDGCLPFGLEEPTDLQDHQMTAKHAWNSVMPFGPAPQRDLVTRSN